MTDRATSRGRKSARRRWLWIGAGLFAAALLGIAGYLRSSGFQEMLRRRVVAAMEARTGGQVQLQQFSFAPGSLQASMRGLVIHGRERAGEPPLFSADLIQANWKIISIWELRADLRSLRVWNPQVYVRVDEKGISNVPRPAVEAAQERNLAVDALALRVTRMEAIRGQMRWNDTRIPLDFQAENFQVGLDYRPKQNAYAGKLDFQNAVVRSAPTEQSVPLRSSGRIQFALYSQKAEIESFEWQTAASQLSGQGTLTDFHSPRLQFHYDIALDWKEAAEALGMRGWQGQSYWRGEGAYAENKWQLEGPLEARAERLKLSTIPDVPWSAHAALRLAASQAGGTFSWRAEIKQLKLAALGGSLSGEASVQTTAAAPATQFRLRAERISMAAVSQAFSNPPYSLPRVRWEGAMSGPVDGSFTGAGLDLVLHADYNVEPPANPPAGMLPVSGVLRGTYRSDRNRVESQSSYLNLPHTHIGFDGWIDTADSHLSVSLDTSRMDEIQSLTTVIGKQAQATPIQIHGRAKADFLWSGGTRAPAASGKIDLTDFEYKNSRWDAFSGSLAYHTKAVAPRVLSELNISSGKLSRGSAAVQFSADVELENGDFTARSPLTADASFRGASIDDLKKLANIDFPLKGTGQGSLKVTGTRDDPRAQGNAVVTSGEAYGESFEKASAQVAIEQGQRISLQQVRVRKGRGTLQGDAMIGWQTKELRFSFTGSNLAIEEFQMLRSAQLPITGVAQLRAAGTGTLSHPTLQGRIDLTKLAVFGQKDGTLSVDLDAKDGKGQLQLAGNFFRSDFRGSGELLLREPFPVSASLQFGTADLIPLLRIFRQPPSEFRAVADGRLTIGLDLKGAKLRLLQGQFDKMAISLAAVDLQNTQPFQFRLENDNLKLEPLHLVGKETDLETGGSIRLARDPVMDLKVKGYVDLAALDVAAQDLAATGRIGVDAVINGSVAKPFWRGSLDFSDASVRYGTFPNGLSKVKGKMVFEGNRGIFENVTAESGGGQLKLTGFVTYVAETGLAMQLSAAIGGVRVRYPEGVSTWADGQLQLTGSPKASTLSGRLVIIKEIASPEFDVGAALVKPQQQPIVAVKAPSFRNMRLDVQVVSAPNVALETTTAKNLKGDIDLRVQGTLDHPVLLGRISILQGEITIGGRRYFADSGDLTFSNPFLIEAILNLHVRARVEQYDINLDFTGPLDRLTVTYSSNPPLPTGEILALLVAGNAYGTTATPATNSTTPAVGASSLLSQALNQQMGSRLDRIFGAGHIRIEPRVAGFGSSANANVAFEQHIKDNLTLLYVTNVSSAQQQLIQAELALSPRFSVAATRDQNGLVGVNFQIKLRFR